MNAVSIYNSLKGVVKRKKLINLIQLAKDQGQLHIALKLSELLSSNKGIKEFDIEVRQKEVEAFPESLNGAVPFIEGSDSDYTGLNRSVSPNDIYDMITSRMLVLIKEASGRGYKKKWTASQYGQGYTIPFNWVSKKRYRGVNHFMLTRFKTLENPFFLTFKQIEKLGAKLKKGSKGHEVVYFTKLYKYWNFKEKLDFGSYDIKKFKAFLNKNKSKIPELKNTSVEDFAKRKYIPILKYYNVFNGSDIEGIDFKLDSFKIGYIENEVKAKKDISLPIPEAIIKHYPSPPPKYGFGGDRAYYQPMADKIQMPYIHDFETAQDYYRTFFHELSHSTGINKRLERNMKGRFGSKPYAFEELVAEWGAVFLSAEAGIIYHANNNHAEYLKNWNSVLTHIKDDNKFIMRACSEAQKVADFVLQFDAKGNPKYLENLKSIKAKSTKEKNDKTESNKLDKQLSLLTEFGLSGVREKLKERYPRDIRKLLIRWAFVNLRHKKIYLDQIGKNVLFNRKGIEHSIKSEYSFNKSILIFEAEEMLKSSTLIGFFDDNRQRSDIKGVYKLKSKSTIQNKDVEITLRVGLNNTIYYDHKIAEIKKPSRTSKGVSTIAKVGEKASGDKSTKDKELKKTKSKKDNGLKVPVITNKGIQALKEKLNFNVASEELKTTSNVFRLPGEIGDFIQDIQAFQELILIKGNKHSSKSQFAMQLADAFSIINMQTAFIDYEQGGLQSKDTQASLKNNTDAENRKNIIIFGDLENPLEDLQKICEYLHVIVADSVTDLRISADELSDLRKKYPHVIWIFISQVKENGAMYGGNKMAHNATKIIECHTHKDYKKRYATLEKNRNNDLTPVYHIFEQRIIKEEEPSGTNKKTTENQDKIMRSDNIENYVFS